MRQYRDPHCLDTQRIAAKQAVPTTENRHRELHPSIASYNRPIAQLAGVATMSFPQWKCHCPHRYLGSNPIDGFFLHRQWYTQTVKKYTLGMP